MPCSGASCPECWNSLRACGRSRTNCIRRRNGISVRKTGYLMLNFRLSGVVGTTGLAPIAVAAKIAGAAVLRGAAGEVDPRIAVAGGDRLQLFEKDRPREIVALRIADPRC